MSDPRRSEGRTTRLRSEWVGGKRDRHARKGRGEYDDRRRNSHEAEALQRASCHACAMIHGLLARTGLIGAAVGHVLHQGHACRRWRFDASTARRRQHRDREADEKRQNGSTNVHGIAFTAENSRFRDPAVK